MSRSRTVGGTLVGVRPVTMKVEEYQCCRCGIVKASSSRRIYDEKGRRKPMPCKDCSPILEREDRARLAARRPTDARP